MRNWRNMLACVVTLLSTLLTFTAGSGSMTRTATFARVDPALDVWFGATLNSTHITVTVQGPSDRWFAVGFGEAMIGTVALVREFQASSLTIGFFTYILRTKQIIEPYTCDWKAVSVKESGLTAKFVVVRRLTTTATFGVNFTASQSSLKIIYAQAGAAGNISLAYHGINKGAASVSLALPTTTTTGPPGKCSAGSVLTAGASLPPSSMKVTFTADCDTQTITVRLDGPAGRWFGIVFGTAMVPHDCLVYSSGPAAGSEALRDYFCSTRQAQAIVPDTVQYWTQLQNKNVNGRVIAEYRRNWTTPNIHENKQFSADNLNFPVMWAQGIPNENVLRPHTSQNRASSATTLDLYTGSVGTIEPLVATANVIHAGCMFLAFGLLAPCGIWASVFRSTFEGDETWWYIHRCVMPLAICAAIAGLVQAILMVIVSNSGHFNSLHDLIGLFIVIVVVLQPINALLRPDHLEYEDKACDRIIWEIFHKSLGYLAVLSAQYEMYLGVNLLSSITALLPLYFVYEGLLFLAIAIGVYMVCRPKKNGGRSAMASNDDGNDIQITPYNDNGPVQYV